MSTPKGTKPWNAETREISLRQTLEDHDRWIRAELRAGVPHPEFSPRKERTKPRWEELTEAEKIARLTSGRKSSTTTQLGHRTS